MEYRPEMFVGQDKEFPKAGNLKCIGTAFYNLFITQADPEHLNISFQMEDSVVERLKFYRTRVLKEKTYPVFGPVGLYRGNPASVECFQQVTGLPVDKILNEPLPREVDERFIKKVMSKIAFTYVCDYGVGELDEAEATPEILHTNRPCVVNLVNYLIGRGIFMPNIEKLLSDDPLFFLINSYTTGLQPAVLSYMLGSAVAKRHGGVVEAEEIGLPVTASGLVLPCGASGRWESR